MAALKRLYEEKMDSLRAEERSAREEVERLKARRWMIEAAQHDVKALIESYAEAMPEELDDLTPEERHQIYRMLGLSRVRLDNTEAAEIRGVVSVPEKREHINTCLPICKKGLSFSYDREGSVRVEIIT
jgi:hypothetical protein